MNKSVPLEDNLVNKAILACDVFIDMQIRRSRIILLLMVYLVFLVFTVLSFFYYKSSREAINKFQIDAIAGLVLGMKDVATSSSLKTQSPITKSQNDNFISIISTAVNAMAQSAKDPLAKEDNKMFLYFGMVIFIIVFGCLFKLYNFHLSEISKYHHFKFGLVRINIAAKLGDRGYNTEVRTALTDFAFRDYSNVKKIDAKIESPLPGHPTFEFIAGLINKLIEQKESHESNKVNSNKPSA